MRCPRCLGKTQCHDCRLIEQAQMHLEADRSERLRLRQAKPVKPSPSTWGRLSVAATISPELAIRKLIAAEQKRTR